MLRRQQAKLPTLQRAEEFHVAVEERSKVHRCRAVYEVQEQVRPTIGADSDRKLVGEVANGLLGWHPESKVRQLIWPECRRTLEIPGLLPLGAEPSKVVLGEHGVEQHQSFDRAGQ